MKSPHKLNKKGQEYVKGIMEGRRQMNAVWETEVERLEIQHLNELIEIHRNKPAPNTRLTLLIIVYIGSLLALGTVWFLIR